MAAVIRKKNPLGRKYRCLTTVILCCFGISAVSLVLLFDNPSRLSLLWVILVAAGAMLGTTLLDKWRVLRAGVAGEESALMLMRKLPDSYRCYQNVTVKCEGRKSEMDLVITGPGGLFIIEVKNQLGQITGDYNHTLWQQEKIGRKGGKYSKQLFNPVKQVNTHTYRLAKWLRNRKCHAHICNGVLFTNPRTSVVLTGQQGQTPVFCRQQGKQLLAYIQQGQHPLPPKLLAEVNKALDQL